MSSEGVLPFVKIEQGDIFPMTEIVGQSGHDLPSLIHSMKDLKERVNSHLTDMCNYWASVKADFSDISHAGDKGRERKKRKQRENSGKKMKKPNQVEDECN